MTDHNAGSPTGPILVAAAAALTVLAVMIGVIVAPPLMIAMVIGAGQQQQPSTVTIPKGAKVPGIDPIWLEALNKAAASRPKCKGLNWSILAGIGQVESNFAARAKIKPDGETTPRIIGVVLDGSGGTRPIRDTDNGRWDGDKAWDRAVGPFQFIPSSWRSYGVDGNNDGTKDPNNVYDAAAAAALHLCGPGKADLSNPAGLAKALLGYNHSQTYVSTVLSAIKSLAARATPAADTTGDAGVKADGLAAAAIAKAKTTLGTPYSFGGGTPTGPSIGRTAPAGWDCSSLMQYSWYQASGGKIQLPRVTYDQISSSLVRQIPLPQMKPGDLVFIQTDGSTWSHVTMYLGGGKIIEEPHTGAVSRIMPLSEYDGRAMAARRVKAAEES